MNSVIKIAIIYAVFLLIFFNDNSIVLAQSSKISAPLSAVQLISEKENAVVKIRSHSKSQHTDEDCGTGFFIDRDGTVITNYHVVKEYWGEDLSDFFVETIDGKTFERDTIIGYNPIADVFVFKVKNPDNIDFPFLKIDEKNSSKGQEIFLIGHPAEFNWLYSPGFITGYFNDKDSLNDYVFDAEVMPGSSGSPMFNSKGDVIGIVKATYGATGNFNLATRSSFFSKLNPYPFVSEKNFKNNLINDPENGFNEDDTFWESQYDFDSMDGNSLNGNVHYEYLYNKYMNQGKLFETAKKYYSAIFYYKKAKEIKTHSEFILMKLSNLYFKVGDYLNAIAVASSSLKSNPDNTDALNMKGKCWFELGNYKKSKKCFIKIITNDPQNTTALYYIGKIESVKYN